MNSIALCWTWLSEESSIFFPYSARERYLGTRSWTPFLGVGLGLAGGMSDHRLQLLPGVYARLGLKLRLGTRWGLTASGRYAARSPTDWRGWSLW